MLGELLELFAQGALQPLPVKAWDVRQAPHAFRHMSQARHVGKNVLMMPPGALDPEDTVLITGGTGGLGAPGGASPRHRARRSPPGVGQAPRAGRRGRRRAARRAGGGGREVTIAACDVGDRNDLAALLDALPGEHPLGMVVHAAGTLDDGVIESLTAGRLESVLAPRSTAAWHLHELTAHMDLRAFVLFSSVAAVLGNPGQANYAAANAFLDCARGPPPCAGPARDLACMGALGAGQRYDPRTRRRRHRADGALRSAPARHRRGSAALRRRPSRERRADAVRHRSTSPRCAPRRRAGTLPPLFENLVRRAEPSLR